MRKVSDNAPERLRASDAPAPTQPPTQRSGSPWRKVLPELAAVGLCVVLWSRTLDFKSSIGGPGPAVYPRVLIGLFALAMVVRMLQQLRENRRAEAVGPVEHEALPEEGVEFDETLIDGRKVWVAIGFSILYVFSTLFLGWPIATLVFSLVFLLLAGKRNPLFIVPTALVFAFGFTYVFVKVVYISLPTGAGVFDLVTVRLYELMGIY